LKGYHNLNGVARATADAELRYTASGTPVLNIRLALTSSYKSNDEWKDDTVFIDAVFWGKQGEAIAPLVLKGTALLIDRTTLTMDSWEKDGETRTKVKLKLGKCIPLNEIKADGQSYAPQEVSDVEPF
jgi:single-strand DNA-binding protein